MAAVGRGAIGTTGAIGAGGHRAVAAPGRRAALVAVIGAGRAVKGTHPLNRVGAVGAGAAGVVDAHRPGRGPGGATQGLVIADAGAEHLHGTARQGLAEAGGGEGGLGLAVEHVGVIHPLPGPLAETALAIGHAGIEGVAVGVHPAAGIGHGAGAAREHRRRLVLVDLHRLNAVGPRAGHGQVAAEAEGEIPDPLGHLNRQLERLAVARTPIGAVISDGPHAPLVTTAAATDRAAAADRLAVVDVGVEAEADDLAVIEIDSQGLILPTPAEAIQIGGHQAAFAIEAVGAAHGLAVGLAGRVGLGGERPQETRPVGAAIGLRHQRRSAATGQLPAFGAGGKGVLLHQDQRLLLVGREAVPGHQVRISAGRCQGHVAHHLGDAAGPVPEFQVVDGTHQTAAAGRCCQRHAAGPALIGHRGAQAATADRHPVAIENHAAGGLHHGGQVGPGVQRQGNAADHAA